MVTRQLDAAEAMTPGSGSLNLYAGLTDNEDGLRLGAGGELESRLTKGISTFANAWAGLEMQNDRPELAAEAMAGLRVRW